MDFLERLKTEQSELSDKITKLFTFIGTPEFFGLDEENQGLLKIQLESMKTYRRCLLVRLSKAKRK